MPFKCVLGNQKYLLDPMDLHCSRLLIWKNVPLVNQIETDKESFQEKYGWFLIVSK